MFFSSRNMSIIIISHFFLELSISAESPLWAADAFSSSSSCLMLHCTVWWRAALCFSWITTDFPLKTALVLFPREMFRGFWATVTIVLCLVTIHNSATRWFWVVTEKQVGLKNLFIPQSKAKQWLLIRNSTVYHCSTLDVIVKSNGHGH